MMRATSLDEWKAAMRIRARLNSSFTYADRAGNIFYLWNAALPALPHPSGGDSVATPVATTPATRGRRYVPLDSLPQVLNPPGGYVHNENDSPHYTNMRQPLDPARFPSYFPPPRLKLRSQLAIELIDNDRKMSLEDVVALKHSYRMLLADRVRDDLVRAVRATNPTGDVASAIDVIAAWDKTVAPESRGGTLFEIWWRRYTRGARRELRRAVDGRRADDNAARTARSRARRRGVHVGGRGHEATVRRGATSPGATCIACAAATSTSPSAAASSDLGCFRVITYRDGADGKYEATGSDGWILAVEFGDEPRGYSVLAYGESPKPDVAVSRRSGGDVRARPAQTRSPGSSRTSKRRRSGDIAPAKAAVPIRRASPRA